MPDSAGRGRGPLYTPAVALLLAIVGMSFVGTGFVMPLRSLYARDIGATSAEIGLMASAFLLAGFLAAPLVGSLSDRVGHGQVLGVALLAHAALVLAYIPAQAPEALIALRAVEGIAAVGVVPPARALMNGLAPAGRQGEALGTISAAQSVGILFGPAVGTFLAAGVGYEPSFLLAGAALGASGVAVWLALPKRGQAGAAEANDGGRLADLFRVPLTLAYALRLVFTVPHGMFAAIWSLFMADRGASLPMLGLSFTAFAIPSVVLAPLTGRLSDRHGRYWPILVGLVITGGIYLVYSLPIEPLWIITLSLVEGVAIAAAASAVDGLLADVMPRGMRGRVQSYFSAAGLGGSLLGSVAAGILYAIDPGAPFFASGVLTLAAALLLALPPIAGLFPGRTGGERVSAGLPASPPAPRR